MNDNEPSRESLILDIEDLKRQMAALQESEGKYRQWFQDAPISLWEEDFSEVKLRIDEIKRRYAGDLEAYFHAHPDLVRELAGLVKVVDVNEATLRLYKAKTREDFLSGITRVFSTESYETFIPVLMTVGKGETRLFAEKTHMALDGEIIYIQLHWIVPPGYEHTYGRVLVSIIDISARKRTEMALRESEEKYRLIADNMADTVWVMDMNMRFTYVSPSVTRMYGTTVEEVMNQPIALSLVPESLETALKVFSEEMLLEAQGKAAPGRTRILELEEYKSDGSTIWVESSMSFLRDEHNNAVGILGVSRDITDRKRAEAERDALEARTLQLQKAESLGRMAGAIAHHFNNQLQGVIGYLELAMGDLPKGAGPIGSIKEAMRAANRAAGVSRQMLTYLGQTPGKQRPMDLSETCRLALPMLRAGMPANMVLKTDLPPLGPVVHANANQVQQILANLITNAWEAMSEEGGTIYLNAKTVLRTDIPLRRRFPVDWHPECEAYACMEVRDDGPGIFDQEMEKVFDPFFSTKFTGRGLGLSIALGIVRAHGGCITVESRCRAGSGEQGAGSDSNAERGARSAEEKKKTIAMRSAPCALRQDSVGSVFRVFLPLSEETVARPAEKAVQVSGLKGGGTVLLVEDANQVRRLEAQMLELLGWKVLEANDGVEGIEIFREHSNDIRFVLCDLSMPRLDGWQTLAAMRGIRPDIPVILASGYDEASVMAGDQVERPQVFLGKPYGFEELREAIGRTLEPGMNRDAGGRGQEPDIE